MAKIMVVDDDLDILFTTKMMLEIEGYVVAVAKSGEECLENIGIEKPDLLLLDIMLKGEDGWEVCRIIKDNNKTSHIPVVMFTVHTGEDIRSKSILYSKAEAQVDKPFRKEELLETIVESGNYFVVQISSFLNS